MSTTGRVDLSPKMVAPETMKNESLMNHVDDDGESTTSDESSEEDPLPLLDPVLSATVEEAIRMAEESPKATTTPILEESSPDPVPTEDVVVDTIVVEVEEPTMGTEEVESVVANPDQTHSSTPLVDVEDALEVPQVTTDEDTVDLPPPTFVEESADDAVESSSPEITEVLPEVVPPTEEPKEEEEVAVVVPHDAIERARSVDPVDDDCTTNNTHKVVTLGEWANSSKEIFSLENAPAAFAIPHVVEVCDALNDTLWKRYFDARCLLEQACQEDNEATADKLVSRTYLEEIKLACQNDWEGSAVAAYLAPHTYQRATNVTKDQDGDLEDATVVSTIFSPFFLPRAIQLCMRYHRRLEADFWCSWHVQFVSLKDDVEDKMQYWRPHLNDMWEVCSNGYAQMPTSEVGFMPVEEIDTSFLTPNMVRKIRKWLLGSLNSTTAVDDLSLIKYLMATTGVGKDSVLLHGDIGYTWMARDAQEEDMIDYDIDDKLVDHATVIGTNWLEFQCRLITGHLRPIDFWYDPYDLKYHKGKWGEAALEHRFKMHGTRFKNQHIRNNPHKVWDLALRGIMSDTPAPIDQKEQTATDE